MLQVLDAALFPIPHPRSGISYKPLRYFRRYIALSPEALKQPQYSLGAILLFASIIRSCWVYVRGPISTKPSLHRPAECRTKSYKLTSHIPT